MRWKRIESGYELIIISSDESLPVGFTSGRFRVDKKRGYIEIRDSDGFMSGMFFREFVYRKIPDDEEEKGGIYN